MGYSLPPTQHLDGSLTLYGSNARLIDPPKAGRGHATSSHRPFTDGKMLVVTNFRTRFEWQHPPGLGRRALPQPYKVTANVIFSNH